MLAVLWLEAHLFVKARRQLMAAVAVIQECKMHKDALLLYCSLKDNVFACTDV